MKSRTAAAIRRYALAFVATVGLFQAPYTLAGEAELETYSNAGRAAFQAKNYAKAEYFARRALQEIESLHGRQNMLYAQYVGYLVEDLKAQLKLDEAEQAQKALLGLVRSLRGESKDTAWTLSNLAAIQKQLGKLAEAEDSYRQALNLMETVAGREHADTGAVLNYLGILLRTRGKYADAEAIHRRAMRIWERTGGGNIPFSLANLAMVLMDQGKYAEGDRLFTRALEAARESQGPAAQAMLSANYAVALGELGQHARAEMLLRMALEFREGSLGGEHFGVAQTLGQLAGALGSQGKYEESEKAYRRALEILRSHPGADEQDMANVLVNLAQSLIRQERYPEAEPLARQAVDIRSRTLGHGHPKTASGMRLLADALLARGEIAGALELKGAALAVIRRTRNLPELLEATADAAMLLHGGGRLAEALPFYVEALDTLDTLFAQTRGLDEALRLKLIARYAPLYRHMLDLLVELHREDPRAGHDRRALAVASRNQSRIFSEMLRHADVKAFLAEPSFERLRQAHDVALETIATLRQESYSVPMTTPAGQHHYVSLLTRINAEDEALREIRGRLWDEYPRFMELTRPNPVTVGDLQQRLLQEGEVLLTYAALDTRLVIFAVTRKRFDMVLRPLPRKDLAERIRRVRRPLEQASKTGSLRNLKALDPTVLHVLYQDLIAPVEGLLSESRKGRVLVVGDGPLNTLPFEMLVTRYSDSDKTAFRDANRKARRTPEAPMLGGYATLAYLGERYRFSYLPSLASLESQRSHPKPPTAFRKELVSFADPIFSGKDGAAGYSTVTRAAMRTMACSIGAGQAVDLGLARLPESAEEARAIARLVGKAQTLYLGEHAQERAVKRAELSSARYLHFATHGLLGAEFLTLKTLQSTRESACRDSASTAAPVRARQRAQPALVLTLVGDLQGEDGFVTMQEVIEHLDLNAELVVLSACNTAGESERAYNGEGFAGMTRAFMYAGAKGLVVSHWSVESASTTELITEVFAQLMRKKSAVDALAEARAALRTSQMNGIARAHPFFWAPFVYVGG